LEWKPYAGEWVVPKANYDAERTARVEAERERDELRAEGQQMHDDNLTLRQWNRKSRELLERFVDYWNRNWPSNIQTEKVDDFARAFERHLSGEGDDV